MPVFHWKKICCAVDMSEESHFALEAALDLATRFDAEMTLFHANPGDARMADESARMDLQKLLARADQVRKGKVNTAVAKGDPTQAIVEFATQGSFDLIVMGTHGRTGRERSMMGSVAENVVRLSPVPVLTIHAKSR